MKGVINGEEVVAGGWDGAVEVVIAGIHCYGAESNSQWQLEAYHKPLLYFIT